MLVTVSSELSSERTSPVSASGTRSWRCSTREVSQTPRAVPRAQIPDAEKRMTRAARPPTVVDMQRALDIAILDPAEEGQMRRYFEVARRAETEDGRPWNNFFFTYPELSTLMRVPTPERRVIGYCAVDGAVDAAVDAAVDGPNIVAVGMLQLSQLDNLDKAWMIALVEPELRGRGLGGAMVEALVEAAHRNGRTVLLSDAAVPFGDYGDLGPPALRGPARVRPREPRGPPGPGA